MQVAPWHRSTKYWLTVPLCSVAATHDWSISVVEAVVAVKFPGNDGMVAAIETETVDEYGPMLPLLS